MDEVDEALEKKAKQKSLIPEKMTLAMADGHSL